MRNRWISPELQEKSPKIARDELFELVWQEPIYKIGPRYGLSGNGLTKICKRANIPVPPLGYWAKLQHGKKIKRPNLPPTPERQENIITIIPSGLRQVDLEQDLPEDIARAIEGIRSEATPIRVPKSVKIPPEWEKMFPPPTNTHYPFAPRRLSALERREQNIEIVLLQEVEKRGGKIVEGNNYIRKILIAGEKIDFVVRKANKQIQRSSGTEDQAEDSTTIDALQIRIEGYFHVPTRRSWSDTKKERLEDRFAEVLVGFYIVAAQTRKERVEREEQDRRYREAEIARWAAEEKARKRKLEIDQLLQHAKAWSNAVLIRSYVAAVKAAREGVADPSALEEWVQWASSAADEIDPLKSAFKGKPRVDRDIY